MRGLAEWRPHSGIAMPDCIGRATETTFAGLAYSTSGERSFSGGDGAVGIGVILPGGRGPCHTEVDR